MITDNYSQWERHERQAEKWLQSRPICCNCGEPIQEEPVYHPVTGEEICPECLEEYEENKSVKNCEKQKQPQKSKEKKHDP